MPTEAVELLGVSRATLYAYVSRGRVRSEAVPGGNRRSRYSRDDIERLVARSRERRNPAKAAEQALHWGLPILESTITLIADENVYYRGRDASELARSSSLADVAALLWTGAADGGGAFAPVKPYGSAARCAAGRFIRRGGAGCVGSGGGRRSARVRSAAARRRAGGLAHPLAARARRGWR